MIAISLPKVAFIRLSLNSLSAEDFNADCTIAHTCQLQLMHKLLLTKEELPAVSILDVGLKCQCAFILERYLLRGQLFEESKDRILQTQDEDGDINQTERGDEHDHCSCNCEEFVYEYAFIDNIRYHLLLIIDYRREQCCELILSIDLGEKDNLVKVVNWSCAVIKEGPQGGGHIAGQKYLLHLNKP